MSSRLSFSGFVVFCASSSILLGTIVLTGWTFPIDFLKSTLPHFVAMNPLTAVGFIVSGVALLLRSEKSPAFQYLSIAVGLLGLTKLVTLFGLDLGIDQILFHNQLQQAAMLNLPNKMASNSAINFTLISLGLLSIRTENSSWVRYGQLASLVTALTSLLALTGYAYGIAPWMRVEIYVPMAIHTAIGFLLISSGILCARPTEALMGALTSRYHGGKIVRRLLPATIAIPLGMGWLCLLGQKAGYFGPEFGTSLLAVGTMIILTLLVGWPARSLNQIEQALQSQKTLLECIISKMGDGIVVTDRNGKFILFNPEADRLTGIGLIKCEPSEWVKLYSVFLPDRTTPFPLEQMPLVQALHGQETNEIEQYLRHPRMPNGIYISVTGRPLQDDSGQITGAVAVLRDITQKKEYERILKRTNEELEKTIEERISELRESEQQFRHVQKMDAVGKLASGIAHDFNNVLTVIGMYCESLIEDESLRDEARSSVQYILKAQGRAANLTHQLLTFSRKQVVNRRVLNLNEVILDMKEMLRRIVGEHIEVQLSLDQNLSSIEADAGHLEQVLMNLVVNARDAMPSGGTIIIATKELDAPAAELTNADFNQSRQVVMSVTDTGSGMNEETKKRIFDPFFTTKEIGKGTGLGLSTVYGIVQQHKGRIEVSSGLGQGSTFQIFFPHTTKFQTEAGAKQPDLIAARGNETILLVEDQEDLRQIVASVLRKNGYTVLEAINGVEAFSAYQLHRDSIDLVLTDLVMPQMGGLELARKIFNAGGSVKVVYLSGYLDEALHESISEKFHMDFLEKPFSTQILLNKIQDILNR